MPSSSAERISMHSTLIFLALIAILCHSPCHHRALAQSQPLDELTHEELLALESRTLGESGKASHWTADHVNDIQPDSDYVHATYYAYKPHLPLSHFMDHYAMYTHLIYAFIKFDAESNLIPGNQAADRDCLEAMQKIKEAHPALSLGISIGGSGAKNSFRVALGTPLGIQNAVNSVVAFLDEFGFDFVDIDWESPSNATEAGYLENFLIALHERFHSPKGTPKHPAWSPSPPKCYKISMAVPYHVGLLPQHWPSVSVLARTLSYLFIMSYDMEGSWSGFSGHHAALYRSRIYHNYAVSAAVDAILGRGFPEKKLILGIPSYGRKFHGCSGLAHTFDTSASNADGFIDNRHITQKSGRPLTIESKASPDDGLGQETSAGHVYWDPDAKAHYIIDHQERRLISIETAASLRLKIEFIQSRKLGGLFFWELTCDRPLADPECLTRIAYTELQKLRRVAWDSRAMLPSRLSPPRSLTRPDLTTLSTPQRKTHSSRSFAAPPTDSSSFSLEQHPPRVRGISSEPFSHEESFAGYAMDQLVSIY